ncbi:MAG: hypothetical protein PF541_04740 [Prolixibacteraceae bacterium]|jgi:hypothetical protein|nr:hypothetical protein [Prolixibacteraceae bacterium]
MQRMKLTAIFLFTFMNLTVLGRSNITPNGSKAEGMGNAFVSQYDVFSVFHNQAGLAKIDRTSISFFYENRFLVPEMSIRAGLLTFHTNSGNFAIQYNSFGPSNWSESNAGISYAKLLSEKLSVGLQLNYFGTRLPEVNKTAITFSFELGAIYQLNDKTFLGAHIANPYAPQINTLLYEESIPWKISLGGHTNFTKEFTLSYEIETIQNYSPTLQIGAQWEAVENFFVRGGFNTGPARFYTGFGYISHFFTIDTAFSYHQYLGYTPSVSLIFSFF